MTAVCKDMKLFHHLKTVWRFDESPEELRGKNPKTCTLDFAVSFQFRNNIHSGLSGLFFDEVFKQNVNSFLKEAKKRYGSESINRQKPLIYAKR